VKAGACLELIEKPTCDNERLSQKNEIKEVDLR
jgi:hypothetical protein